MDPQPNLRSPVVDPDPPDDEPGFTPAGSTARLMPQRALPRTGNDLPAHAARFRGDASGQAKK